MQNRLSRQAFIALALLVTLTFGCGGGPKGPTGPDQPGPAPVSPSPTPSCFGVRATEYSRIRVGEFGAFSTAPTTRVPGLIFRIKLEWTPVSDADVQLYLYNFSSPPDACLPSKETCAPGIATSTTPGVHPRELVYTLKSPEEQIFVYLRSRGPMDVMWRMTWSYCTS